MECIFQGGSGAVTAEAAPGWGGAGCAGHLCSRQENLFNQRTAENKNYFRSASSSCRRMKTVLMQLFFFCLSFWTTLEVLSVSRLCFEPAS